MALHPTGILQNIATAPMLLQVLVGHAAGEDGLAVVAVRVEGGEGADCGAVEEGAGGASGG